MNAEIAPDRAPTGTMRVAIVAALPGELQPLVVGWRQSVRNGVNMWTWKHDAGEWVAACAGMGAGPAARAFAEIERDGTVCRAISVGWAGALTLAVTAGAVYRVSGVVDARTGERFAAAHSIPGDCLLVTVPRVADPAEKLRLADTYHAQLVDMEAAAIARIAAMRGIAFHAIKGVSDGLQDKLPDFNAFTGPRGEFRFRSFAIHAILRPYYWPGLIRMGENSKKAAVGIAEAVLDFLDDRGHIRRRNGYPDSKSGN